MIDIKKRLAEKHINSSQLAMMVGVTRQSISQIASGKCKPRIETAKRIADILDIDWKDLF
ncbi:MULTISPECIES: helix-turn-helix transcriptional regulator [Bacteria]|uniref:XRE family transcriptional regulator n=1 Tax=Cellulomonas carbonis T26 TaxID=947969 RepID=A0A0A0BIW7_9CELL|nr:MULTISPECIES: helix-turn-helix transcriptional regulator [Bacteria]KGM08458.1 XRE family transcriptional regulator [Cellulomonas carbonis T26]KSV94858.1 hypothetical protein N184_36020 [Sinorhizobium sp. GL28]